MMRSDALHSFLRSIINAQAGLPPTRADLEDWTAQLEAATPAPVILVGHAGETLADGPVWLYDKAHAIPVRVDVALVRAECARRGFPYPD